ncbi:jg11169 [Pararge aegeria aegeria]|uniref:Jg11169 protein n=1 Tax=Pararge aegeria aegeria TaxID=348720 RepID=A0A8S4RIE9_9NEOP|nr:jg11169 [Pararge aegeria aegeria]
MFVVALKSVVAEGENEVKRGSFPFMAYLYYLDETILENDARFTRSAALISNDWLISSGDVSVKFPQKTLLARLGAVNIILILRPSNYTATQWWKTDISLLKTLLPFNNTLSVAPVILVSNSDIPYKNCYILVYASRDNVTERTLIQMTVELLPPTQEDCGNYYGKETMACANELDKNALTDPNFCQGNKGGPLICNNELIGLQTYVNDCKQPHLYQLVNAWEKFINCAAKGRFLTEPCSKVSIAITKDPPTPTLDTPRVSEIIDDTNSQSVHAESNTQFNKAVTENLSTLMVEEPTLTSEIGSKYSYEQTEINDRNEEQITTNTSVLIENYSHDTSTTEVTHNAEETVMDSTDERDRKNPIETQYQLVNGDALLNIPTLFHYLVTFVLVL